jgi:heat-inducible transcriptional repressor
VLRIDLAQASRRSALLVILTSAGVVKSRICKGDEDLDYDMTSFFTNLLNDRIAGRPLNEITPELKNDIRGELYEYTRALSPVLDAVFSEIGGIGDSEVILGGETNLLSHAAFYGDRALELVRFLETKADLAGLMEDVREGVRVRIGTEIGPDFMKDSSVIAAPYRVDGIPSGAIGIIGPTRMNYAKLMSNMKYFSAVLGKLISETFFD